MIRSSDQTEGQEEMNTGEGQPGKDKQPEVDGPIADMPEGCPTAKIFDTEVERIADPGRIMPDESGHT